MSFAVEQFNHKDFDIQFNFAWYTYVPAYSSSLNNIIKFVAFL